MIIAQMIFFICFGCGTHIRQDYALQKERGLSSLPAMQKNEAWSPDIRLRIRYDQIEKLCLKELQRIIGTGKLRAQAIGFSVEAIATNHVKTLRITDNEMNERFTIKATIDGTITWRAGFLGVNLPYSAIFEGRARIGFKKGLFYADLEKMERFHLGFHEKSRIDFTQQLTGLVEEQLTQFGRINLGRVDLTQLPIRSARVNSTQHTADLELRSDSPALSNLGVLDHKPGSDWELQLTQELMGSWMRKTAFQNKESRFGFVPDPIRFSMTENQFDLTLRLWHMTFFNAWWREYQILGDVVILEEAIELNQQSIQKLPQKGEGIRDPLSFFLDGIIIDTIRSKLDLSIPNTKAFSGKKGTITATLNSIRGQNQAVLIGGKASIDRVNE